MAKSLPSCPNLELLRKQAKYLLQRHRSASAACCERLRLLERFRTRTDLEILSSEVKLSEAQHALAKDYGFVSWRELLTHVEHNPPLPPSGARDYSKIELQGNGFVEDSFCLTMAAASRLLPLDLDYEAFLAITGNAFGPGFDTGNDCKELWVAEAWVSAVAAMGSPWHRVGLTVTQMPFEPSGGGAGGGCPKGWTRQIREAVDAGRIIVIAEGWKQVLELSAVVEFWWAGIVTEVWDDGVILGAHTNGKRDVVLDRIIPGNVFEISSCVATGDSRRLLIDVLSRAVDRIQAIGQFSRGKFNAFGVDAMDDWILQMRDVPHFSPPFQQGAGTARRIAYVMAERSKAAAGFLRKQLGCSPKKSQRSMTAAAEAFDGIVGLLRPYLSDDSEKGYQHFIGDLTLQSKHAEEVLLPVKNELARAADSMKDALNELSR